jgi:predicted branched-subunit amino acid permease
VEVQVAIIAFPNKDIRNEMALLSNLSTSSHWLKGMKDGMPICLGYFAVSFTFGMMAVAQGLSIGDAVFISAANLTSAGQFAGLTLISAGAPYYEMAVAQLIINMRYFLMSFALSQKLERNIPFLHRFLVAYGVTDEIFAVSVSQEGRVSPYYSYGAMSVAVPGWVLGTLAGAISGNLLPDFIVSALGIAIYGMFLAIIIPPAAKNRVVLGVVVGAMLMSGLFRFVPVLDKVSPGLVIIITTILVAGTAAYLYPIEEVAVREG